MLALKIISITLLGLMISACGVIKKKSSDGGADYKTSRTLPSLEVPPDLTSSSIDNETSIPEASTPITLSDYSDGREYSRAKTKVNVLPEQGNLRVEHEGDRQWLVVYGEPDQIWPELRQFWTSSGFVIKVDEPKIGIMETDWAENRADIPKGVIRNVIGKVFDSAYSAATRDKFRVRLERGQEEGTTELFLTHRGVEEVLQGEEGDVENVVWRRRPSDPELEIEMLKRIMVRLGVQQQRADVLLASKSEPKNKARLVENKGGVTTLVIFDSFPQAWRRTGIALDRVGFVVEDRNRSQGLYFVRYDDPEKSQKKRGWLSKMNPFGKNPDKKNKKYQIKLNSQEAETRVIVLDGEGKQDDSGTSRRILALLYEQLK